MWRVLLLHVTARPRAVRSTTRQHLEALERLPGAEVLAYNAVHGPPPWLRHLRFDAVVLHTTYLCLRWSVWFEHWKRRSEWLADLDCLKVAFPQDEYDHAAVLDEWLDELGVSVVCSVLDDTHRGELYPKLSDTAAFYEVLTGYIDDDAAARVGSRLIAPSERPYDIVYRARKPPYWFGSHSQLKHRIGEEVAARAGAHGLACDISTRMQETVLGDAWLDFLGSGRATIGVESGSSALDRRGETKARIGELLHRDPTISFEGVAAQMPAGWDGYRFVAVSPRHLEAAVTRTAQILVEGRYSGVLEPQRHYLPVRADFSDLDEVLERARDRELLEQIAAQCYEDVYLSGRYSSGRLTEALEQVLAEHGRRAPRRDGGLDLFPAIEQVASAESEVERIAVAPVANVLRVGRVGAREMIAGLRLVATDHDSRRLLVDYLRSTETREYVSPREALADLLLVGSYRRAQAGQHDGGKPFRVSTELDEERKRVVLRAQPPDGARADNGITETTAELADLLRSPGWDFLLDHSEVGGEIECRLAGSRRLRVPVPAGPRPLKTLNWLARSRPGDVADALGPILG